MDIISIMLLTYPISGFIGIASIRKFIKILADNGYKITPDREKDNSEQVSFEIKPLYIPGINVGYVSVLCMKMLTKTEYLIDYLRISGAITELSAAEELVYKMNPTVSTAFKLNLDDSFVPRKLAKITSLEISKRIKKYNNSNLPLTSITELDLNNYEEDEINYDIDSKDSDANKSPSIQETIVNNIKNKRFITHNKNGDEAYITFLEEKENIIITDVDGYLLSLNSEELKTEIINIIKEKLLIISPQFKEDEVKVLLESSSKTTLIGNISFEDLIPNDNYVDVIYYRDPRTLSRELITPTSEKVLKKVRKDII